MKERESQNSERIPVPEGRSEKYLLIRILNDQDITTNLMVVRDVLDRNGQKVGKREILVNLLGDSQNLPRSGRWEIIELKRHCHP